MVLTAFTMDWMTLYRRQEAPPLEKPYLMVSSHLWLGVSLAFTPHWRAQEGEAPADYNNVLGTRAE